MTVIPLPQLLKFHEEHWSKYTQTRTRRYEHSFSNYSDHGRSRKRNRYHDDKSSILDSGGNHYEGRNHLDSNQERRYSRSSMNMNHALDLTSGSDPPAIGIAQQFI